MTETVVTNAQTEKETIMTETVVANAQTEKETTMTETVANGERVNKSKLILAVFKEKGLDTPANDIVDAVKATAGVDVTVNLVNTLRFKERKEKVARKEKRAKAPADPLAKLFALKEFAAQMGGLSELKVLISKLEALAA